jgi:putative lipoic acid-binding regulatory protein
MQKLEIGYPCEWIYKIIGNDESRLRAAAQSIICGKEFTIDVSRGSSRGTYVCLNLKLTVLNEQERTSIFSALGTHADIKLVL